MRYAIAGFSNDINRAVFLSNTTTQKYNEDETDTRSIAR